MQVTTWYNQSYQMKKKLNRYDPPILHECMNNRHGRSKFNNF